jgi:hypothetical protein
LSLTDALYIALFPASMSLEPEFGYRAKCQIAYATAAAMSASGPYVAIRL